LNEPQLRLYNEKLDVICPYYSLTHRNSSTMYCISTRPVRRTTIAKICCRTDCCKLMLSEIF